MIKRELRLISRSLCTSKYFAPILSNQGANQLGRLSVGELLRDVPTKAFVKVTVKNAIGAQFLTLSFLSRKLFKVLGNKRSLFYVKTPLKLVLETNVLLSSSSSTAKCGKYFNSSEKTTQKQQKTKTELRWDNFPQ